MITYFTHRPEDMERRSSSQPIVSLCPTYLLRAFLFLLLLSFCSFVVSFPNRPTSLDTFTSGSQQLVWSSADLAIMTFRPYSQRTPPFLVDIYALDTPISITTSTGYRSSLGKAKYNTVGRCGGFAIFVNF